MLHLIKNAHALDDALLVCVQTDVIVLMEDAVYAATPQHKWNAQLSAYRCYALHEDVLARGLEKHLSPLISMADYPALVDLTVEHSPSLTWN